MRFLAGLCDQISAVYEPGARITICADGRVFADLIGVPDAHVSAYQRAMARLVAREAPDALRLFTLDDAAAGLCPDQLRRDLDSRYSESLEQLRAEIRANENTRATYLGIVRFLVEDRLGPDYQGTRSALQRESRDRAYGVVARSRAWGRLVGDRFPHAVRLSIHPQPCGSAKLGILLGGGADSWLTPWHSVAVQGGGRFQLMKRAEAERLGAVLVLDRGRPSHFVLTNSCT